MNVFELFGTIAVDSSGAERGIDKTVGHARDAESKLEKTFKKIGTVVAAAFAIDKIVDFGKACTEAYASIAAEESAFAQIMGDYADTAQKKLQAVSDATGVTSTRLTGAMTSLTAKFKGLGYGVEDATTLATDGLLIASDAAAFWDMSLDESMSHLNSFINGSYEGGEAIGLFANDTQMAAYAVEKGIVSETKAWSALDEATKQATRLDYAKNMQQQSGATGQAAKEASSYANVMANLKEHWRQFQGVVGKPILEKIVLPAMQKLEKFMPKLTESVQGGIEWLTEGFDKIAAYFSDVFTEDGLNMDALPDALTKMFRDLGRTIPNLLARVGGTIRSTWTNSIWASIQKGFKAIFGVDLPEWGEIKRTVTDWWNGDNGIKAGIASVCNWTLNMFGVPANVTLEDVTKVLNTWWPNTKTTVQDFCTWALKMFTEPSEGAAAAGKVVKEWWKDVKSGAEAALDWTLKLFGVPLATADAVKNLVSGWWSGVKTAAQNALNWTLKLFANPQETAGEVATRISTWWAGVAASAQGVLNWVLKLFDNPKEAADDVGEFVGDWWDGVKSGAEAALTWVLQLFGAPADPSETDISTLLNAWWTGVKSMLGKVCTWTLNLFGVPFTPTELGVRFVLNAWWNKTKTLVSKACAWGLSIFNPPTEDGTSVVETWWKGVKESIEKAIGIDLPNVDISGIFSAGETAINSLITTAGTLYTDLQSAIVTDETGKIKLDATLSNLFETGVNAMADLLTTASTLVTDIAGNITGDEESAKKVGAFFSDLFGWTAEMAIGVKDDVLALLNWLYNNGDRVSSILAGVAIAAQGFALSNPVILGIEALVGLIAVLTTDWENFEKNYPELAKFFEDMTGLNFDTVAGSMATFQTELKSLITWFGNNKDALDGLLILLGGLAMTTGHYLAGAALITTGGYSVWKEAVALTENADSPANNTSYGDRLRYAQQMYSNPAEYGLTESQLSEYIDVLKTMNPNAEGYDEAAHAVVDAWTEKHGTDDSGYPGGNSSNQKTLIDDLGLTQRGSNLPNNTTEQTGLIGAVNTLIQTLTNADIKTAAREGVAEGMSGITITGHITTGDVKLNDGTLVGALAQKLNMRLGWQNALESRG